MGKFKHSAPEDVVTTFNKHEWSGHVCLHDCLVLKEFFTLAVENHEGKIPWFDVSLERARERVRSNEVK